MESEIRLDETGHIVLDGEIVGYLGWYDNVMVDIHIKSEYRNQGFATEAVSQLVQRLSAEYDVVVVGTTVLKSAMERVLKKNGFTRSVDTTSLIDEEQIPAVENPPTREEVTWSKSI